MIVHDTGKSKRTAAVLAVVLLVLQLGFAPNIAILGGRANLALVFVGLTCLGGQPAHAPWQGFLAGLAYDLCGSGPIGLMAILLTLTAWVFAASDRPAPTEDATGALMAFVPMALVVGVAYAICLLVLGQAGSFVDAVFLRAIPGAVLDCLSFALASWVLAHTGAGPSSGLSLGAAGRKGSHYSLKRGR